MRVRRVIPLILVAFGALGVFSPSALAEAAGPGWQLFADTYPTNLVKPVDEVQEVTASEESGTFTLSYGGVETKNPIHDNAIDAEVQSELEGIPEIGHGNIAVTGTTPGHFIITFTGALGNEKVAELEASGATATVKTAGATSGMVGIEVFNVGAGASTGPITVTDTLPPGVRAKEAGQFRGFGFGGFGVDPIIKQGSWTCSGNGSGASPSVAGATIVSCTDTEGFQGGGGQPTYNNSAELNNPQPVIGITVEATAEATGLTNHVAIAGGGAIEPAATTDPVTISSQPASGGVTHADAWFSNADGTVDRQAGSHPYTATFVFDVATALNSEGEATFPGSEVRNLETTVPPGFIGDLHSMPECTREQLITSSCPPASMVGLLKAPSPFFLSIQAGVFNMVPPPGAPAELGFEYGNVPVYISFKVHTGGNYAIVARVNNIPQRNIFQSALTLWGVPEEASHDRWRYREGGCSQAEMESRAGFAAEDVDYCLAPEDPIVTPFLSLPTECGVAQPFAFKELSGWQEPGATSEVSFLSHDAEGKEAGFTGCESLVFEPAITTSPDTAKADTPTGLTVEVKPPVGGLQEPTGEGSADIEDTVVALPVGLVINPGQAAGLQACGAAEDGLTTEAEKAKGEEDDGPASCPNASKVGTVVIKSPLIEGDPEKQFEGNVYVLQSNPPELKLLVAASADGVNLKLVGTASLCETAGEVLHGKSCEAPGQVIAAFENTPQLPFTLFKLSFSGGPQAALDTPAQCGTYTASADFTPWSSPFVSDFSTTAAFSLTEGPGGSGCPSSPMPFTPTLTAGATTDQAGGFTSFSMLLQRGDGQQRIEKLAFKAPEGLSAMISKVPLCDEADANAGTCPASSHIGHATVTSGPGPYPLVVPQPGEPEAPIYLTGPYKGQPFGLSIVTPVIAGPFNLGTIITRASIAVDPHTAQITVTTDPLPQIVKGVPTDLREIQAVIDRPGFMFNPTNCNPQEFSGTATSAGGAATTAIASHFQVGSCQSLKFEPKLAVSIPGHASKALGEGLTAKLTYPNVPQGTDANISKVKVDLPVQLPSQLKTLQKACLAATFAANPANCPGQSIVGHATVTTPLLPVPLTGPAYFVSHAGEEFPSLTMVLQGYGVTIDLVGTTFISKSGITSTTFKTVPDVPFNTFELTLPQGQYAALGVNLPAKDEYNYCGQKLAMPTLFVAQNGAEIHQSTPISIEGCPTTLAIAHHTVNNKTVTLTVYVPAAGTLKATARGLNPATKSSKGRETITLSLTQRHPGKLTTKIKLTYTPTKGHKQTASLAAKLTK
jgi:hypothetical protein